MAGMLPAKRGKRLRSNRGFSLLEALLVVVLISILAGVVVPRYAYQHVTRQKVYATAHNIAADLRYARRLSIGRGVKGSGSNHWLRLYTVGTATDTWRVFEDGNEAAYLKAYTVPGNDIRIKGAATDSFYFDYRGIPEPANGGYISVYDNENRFQWNVSVVANTGRIQLIQIK